MYLTYSAHFCDFLVETIKNTTEMDIQMAILTSGAPGGISIKLECI